MLEREAAAILGAVPPKSPCMAKATRSRFLFRHPKRDNRFRQQRGQDTGVVCNWPEGFCERWESMSIAPGHTTRTGVPQMRLQTSKSLRWRGRTAQLPPPWSLGDVPVSGAFSVGVWLVTRWASSGAPSKGLIPSRPCPPTCLFIQANGPGSQGQESRKASL